LVDRLAKKFAAGINRPCVAETQSLDIGDVYVRFLPGLGGSQCTLYVFNGHNALGAWVARLTMRSHSARIVAKVNFNGESQHKSVLSYPAGVRPTLKPDGPRQFLQLTGVELKNVDETGRYIARMWQAGLIGAKR
jgi:hypothetical protein